MARRGAKLNYLRSLKDQCPEGTELQFFKAGGRVCSKCMKKKAEKGAMIESKKCGGEKKVMTKAMEGIKIEMAKCVLKPKQKEIVHPYDTVHDNGKPKSLVNIDGPLTKKYPPITNDDYQRWKKEAARGNKDAARKIKKQDDIQTEKCGGRVKKSELGGKNISDKQIAKK